MAELTAFFPGPAATDLPDGHGVGAGEIEAELDRIGHVLRPLDIVLVNTRAGDRYGQPDYVASGGGVGREGTRWLAERGVRVVGTDGWPWDAPFVHAARTWGERRDPAAGAGWSRFSATSDVNRLIDISRAAKPGTDRWVRG